MPVLGLPPIPAELKSVAPYLQRAEEVKAQDPVIAYWCAYYAAQLGVALKLRDHASRVFLMDLLGLLEQIKADIGPNDAIEDDAASAAYVENFALRVFQLADNEDRRGGATRGTAKKFLAAANFLEVLTTFAASASADTTTTVDVPEKIRYAKWKAADIAKALREGRKPAPGGIDEPQPDELDAAPAADASVAPAAGAGTSAWVGPELEGREDAYERRAPDDEHEAHVSPESASPPMGGGGLPSGESGVHEELSTHGVHDFAQPSPSGPSFALPSVPSEPYLPSVPSEPYLPSVPSEPTLPSAPHGAPLGPPPSAPVLPPVSPPAHAAAPPPAVAPAAPAQRPAAAARLLPPLCAPRCTSPRCSSFRTRSCTRAHPRTGPSPAAARRRTRARARARDGREDPAALQVRDLGARLRGRGHRAEGAAPRAADARRLAVGGGVRDQVTGICCIYLDEDANESKNKK